VKDKEDLKRKVDTKDRENLQGTKKEEELLNKLEELQKQSKERDILTEKRAEENFNLK
jgi:hypothetical protein